MTFGKDSKERAMFGDFYRLCERFWEPQEDNKLEWWQDQLNAVDAFIRDYETDTDSTARALAVVLMTRADDIANKRPVICETRSSGAIPILLDKLLELTKGGEP